jgi:hypothetical protein
LTAFFLQGDSMLIDTSSLTWRPLLHDTALHIALLTQGAQSASLDAWRARCAALIDQVTRTLRDDGAEAAWVDEVSLSLCVLLDGVTLRQLPVERHPDWLREALQMRFHATDAGTRRICASLDALLDDGVASPERIEWYCLLMEMGLFDGLPERDDYDWRLLVSTSNERGADDIADEGVPWRNGERRDWPKAAVTLPASPGRAASTPRIRSVGVSVALALACVALAWGLADLYLERLAGERLRDGAVVVLPDAPSWRL